MRSKTRFACDAGERRGRRAAMSVALFALLAGYAAIASAQIATMVEFYNRSLDHYFLSLDPQEIDDLDAGRRPGWARTGDGFSAYLTGGDGTTPVCRFYIPPDDGDSHFFSASPTECSETQSRFPRLLLESPSAFHVVLPSAEGACADGTIPVYRLWNGRADSNHRYTADVTVRDAMIAKGYTPEGYGGDAVAMCAPVSSPALPLAVGTRFAPPLRIVRGGTYTGQWESLDPKTPAVVIDTTEEVVIENCVVRSRANLIGVARDRVRATVRNCRGYGLDSGAPGQERGAFFEAFRIASLTFEHNYVEGTAEGIVLIDYAGATSGEPTIRIRYNRARNLMGLVSDGAGGVSIDGDLGNEGNGNHFIVFDKLQRLPGAEIAWNEIVNDPYVSSIGDKINIYKSSGTAAAPIDIHDNLIRGGYGIRPLQPEYSGGGVITDGSGGDSTSEATAFVKIHDNQFINGPNFAVSLAAGHDNEVYANRAVSTGRLSSGEWMSAPYGNGFNVWNGYRQSAFANNVARDNASGWIVRSANGGTAVRKDFYVPDCASAAGATLCVGNAPIPGEITADTENDEYARWLRKLADNAIAIGPQPEAAASQRRETRSADRAGVSILR